jgi:hypothetical protein
MRCDVVDQNSPRCASVVRAGHRAEAFSSCSVPKLSRIRRGRAIYEVRKVVPEALCVFFVYRFQLE